ncbi:membrane protein [Flavimobilis marinus]|uniref:Putative membrane protein n=1 Tax=Flavimobilis marinus TaxID=285351 RepID=A0A1I2HYI6_9MICO|nr:phage holin family protein [Flavimobilis marinus]GHG49510.1 membrane protein [Flavimobilis marinus]SFF34410.1 putative membrane protein [Flavimobilis marinus]
MGFLARTLVTALGLWVATSLVGGVDVVGAETPGGTAVVLGVVALVLGLVNAVVRPVVAFLAFPLYILTLGLFFLVVNALMLILTAWLTELLPWGLAVDGFWSAFFAAVVVSVVTLVGNLVVPD